MIRGKKHPILLLETGFSKSRLLANFIKLTTLFSVFYIVVSWVIGFQPGIIVMTCNTLVFLLNLVLYTSEKLNFRISANIYIANCMFVAIMLCTYFSGGIFSPVLPWFILIPTISLLLLGICQNTLLWLVLTILVVLAYGQDLYHYLRFRVGAYCLPGNPSF
jgi:hypothetical protein